MNTKVKLFQACNKYLQKRAKTVENTIRSHQNALQSETKSSAGDKHETGRAMLQLEMEKASQQLADIRQMRETLAKVKIATDSEIAHLGSLVYTNKGNYFLSISAGQLQIDQEPYFAISVSSPIGKLLLGKRKNDLLVFHGNSITIKAIH